MNMNLLLSIMDKNPSINISLLILGGVIVIGLAVLAFRQQKEKIVHSWKKEKWQIIGTTLLYAVAMIFLFSLLRQLAQIISEAKQIEKPINQQLIDEQLQQQKASFWGKMLLGFNIVIWAPFFEELVFRWLIFETFGKNYFSILISTFAFGFAHYLGGQSVIFVLPYLIMGFALSYVYRQKKYNILWPFFFHFFNNLIAFCFMLLALK